MGCTKWGTEAVYGPRREVDRRLLGSPAIATSKSSSLNAGFAGARGGGIAVAGLSGNTESLSLTHCVQQAEITYEQPYELHPVPQGRVNDVAGGVLLGFLGLGVMIASKVRSTTIWEPGDPFYEEPPSAAPGYLLGGAMIAGGVGLIAYSFGSLPKGPKPEVRTSMNRFTHVEMVESSGCGLPGDPGIAKQAAPPDTETVARLRQLDQLRAAGTITEAEYQQKRREILDAI
jgi:hypothetical protein